ncbi:hypothetical protein EXN24_19575, partial [Rhizobium rhizogenes]
KSPWKTTSSQLINMISLERKTSSPAAPPPSFSERTYREQLALTSMGKKENPWKKTGAKIPQNNQHFGGMDVVWTIISRITMAFLVVRFHHTEAYACSNCRIELNTAVVGLRHECKLDRRNISSECYP